MNKSKKQNQDTSLDVVKNEPRFIRKTVSKRIKIYFILKYIVIDINRKVLQFATSQKVKNYEKIALSKIPRTGRIISKFESNQLLLDRSLVNEKLTIDNPVPNALKLL